jgi:hypothetical protein
MMCKSAGQAPASRRGAATCEACALGCRSHRRRAQLHAAMTPSRSVYVSWRPAFANLGYGAALAPLLETWRRALSIPVRQRPPSPVERSKVEQTLRNCTMRSFGARSSSHPAAACRAMAVATRPQLRQAINLALCAMYLDTPRALAAPSSLCAGDGNQILVQLCVRQGRTVVLVAASVAPVWREHLQCGT